MVERSNEKQRSERFARIIAIDAKTAHDEVRASIDVTAQLEPLTVIASEPRDRGGCLGAKESVSENGDIGSRLTPSTGRREECGSFEAS
jgi:hypothetical protein